VSRYYRNLTVLVIVIFIVAGCAAKSNFVKNIFKISDYELLENDLKEDRLSIFAIDAYNRRDFKNSTKYYKTLYNQTNKIIYASRAIESASLVKDFDSVEEIIKQVDENNQTSPEMQRYLVAYSIDKKEYKKAKKLAQVLYEKNKTAKNMELLALAYEGLEEYDDAINFYDKAYQENKNTYSLLRKFNILYLKTDQKQKAIRILETHKAINGCSREVCTKLLQHYALSKDLDGVERLLKALYKKSKHQIYAKKLIQLYSSNKSQDKAIEFLKDTNFDDLLLLNLYTSKKDYKSAFKLANKLYKQKQEPELLARSAILEYESTKSNMTKIKLKSITDKFEKVVNTLEDPLYYNYYGYLLIDHDLDIDKGMDLVKKALKTEPDSHFYIDSLAWGMYKRGEIESAYKLLKPIAEADKEQEIQEHFKIIKKAMKNK
jgi:tetratricopeptide (TPR) repeat protein